jgi:peptidoglycan/LPS O-acetylase OafA/YrhL
MMVDILLMLSGFLLFLPYARHLIEKQPLPDLREYYKKRAVRILPSYLFCIAVVLFAYALPQGKYYSSEHMWTDVLSHLTFTHNLFPMAYQGTQLNGVLWTLAVEVQFYLIAPFVCWVFMKKPLLSYVLMVGGAFAYRTFYVMPMADYSLHLNRLPAMLDAYANGMMGALLYVVLCRYMRPAGWKSLLMTAISVLCGIAVFKLMRGQSRVSGGYPFIHIGQMLRRFPLTAAGALMLVCSSHALSFVIRIIASKPIRYLSMISYNIYIWHAFLMLRLKEWHIPPYTSVNPNMAGEQPWQTLFTWLAMLAAIAAGALATHLIEKPCAKLLLRKKAAPALRTKKAH